MKFDTGMIVYTPGIQEIMDNEEAGASTVIKCLDRHMSGDWGDLCDEDKQMNDDAITAELTGSMTDRLFSSYDTELGTIYVITEYDRSVTTVLLPEEY